MVALRIALRYLFSRKSHNVVNIISIISMAGVAVATIAIVCVLSVFNGFSDLAYDKLSAINPEIKIVPTTGKVIENADSLALALNRLDRVATALPTISEQALAIYGRRQMPVTLFGIPQNYADVSDIEQTVIDGELLNGKGFVDERVAAASVGTAMKIGVRAGYIEPIGIFVPRRRGQINPANPMTGFRSDSVRVTAVYQVEESEHDANTLIVDLPMARQLLDYTSQATAIEIKSSDGDTDATIDAIRAHLAESGAGESLAILDRLRQEQQSFNMIAIEKWITFTMLALILVIASFNVVSTLSMLIIEKRDNMATLRALGATPGMIRSIFVWEGWLISLTGGIIGLIAGVTLCLAQQFGGFIKLSGDPSQLSITTYPVHVRPMDLIMVFGLVVLTGLFISAIAARVAPKSRINNDV